MHHFKATTAHYVLWTTFVNIFTVKLILVSVCVGMIPEHVFVSD